MSRNKSCSALSFIKKMDFLGPEFNFESEDSIRHRSLQGAFFSLITFITAVVIAFIFGREVYERKTPNVSSSREFLSYSKIYLKDYPLLFTFLYDDTSDIPNITDVLDFRVESFSVDEVTSSVTGRFNYTLVNCKEQVNSFTTHKEQIMYMLYNTAYTFYCINFDDSMNIQNELSVNNSTFVRVLMSVCKEEERNSCDLSRADILQTQPQLVFTYVDHYVDSIDYDNPVVSYINRITQPLSFGLNKLLLFQITNNAFISDNGWLFEDKHIINYTYLSNYKTDSNALTGDIHYILNMVLESPRLRTKDSRSYMKIQELFARVGGIANALFIIISALTYDYLRFLFLIFIRENSFEMMDNNLINSIVNSNNNNRKNNNYSNSNDNHFSSFNHKSSGITKVIEENNNANNKFCKCDSRISSSGINNISLYRNNSCNNEINYNSINQFTSNRKPTHISSYINTKVDNNYNSHNAHNANNVSSISNANIEDDMNHNQNKLCKIINTKGSNNRDILDSNIINIPYDVNNNSNNNNTSKIKHYTADFNRSNVLNNDSKNNSNNSNIKLNSINNSNMSNCLNNQNSVNIEYNQGDSSNYIKLNNSNLKIKDYNLNNNSIDLNNNNNNNKFNSKSKVNNHSFKPNSTNISNIKLIKKFKEEVADIIYGNSLKQFKKGEKISYFYYSLSYFCFCLIDKGTKEKYDYEMTRIKKLLDIKTFKHFLMESYYIHYSNNFQNSME